MKHLNRHTRDFRRVLGRARKIKKGKLRTEEGGVVISEQQYTPIKNQGVFPNNKQGRRVFLGLPSVFVSLSKQTEKAY